jgi:hypothetical protein
VIVATLVCLALAGAWFAHSTHGTPEPKKTFAPVFGPDGESIGRPDSVRTPAPTYIIPTP